MSSVIQRLRRFRFFRLFARPRPPPVGRPWALPVPPPPPLDWLAVCTGADGGEYSGAAAGGRIAGAAGGRDGDAYDGSAPRAAMRVRRVDHRGSRSFQIATSGVAT